MTGPSRILPPLPLNFTPDEIRSFQNDDAMATGMIGVILGLAFVLLLTLAVGVSVWTLMVFGAGIDLSESNSHRN